MVNLRAALTAPCDDAECGPVLEARVVSEAGAELATRSFSSDDFRDTSVYQNLPVHFRLQNAESVHVEVEYTGFGAVTIDYVEVFRQGRQLVLSPPSGVLADGTAKEELTEFRRIVTAPADSLLASCADETQVVVELMNGSWASETSEVRYTPEA